MSKPMRVVAVALMAAAALGLAACANEASNPGVTVSDGTAQVSSGVLPVVSAGDGEPTLSWPTTPAPSALASEIITKGTGEPVGESDFVVANYSGWVWGKQDPFDSSFNRTGPGAFSLDRVVPGWAKGLIGAPVGSRVLISIPPADGYGETGAPEVGIAPNDTIVFVVDVLTKYGKEEAGPADVTPTNEEVPVTFGPAGQPATLSVNPGTPEPTTQSFHLLDRGSGEPVGENDSVVFAFTQAAWDNSSVISTWPSIGEPGVGTSASELTNFPQEIIGVPVGSRVLQIIPAAEGGAASALLLVILGTFPASNPVAG